MLNYIWFALIVIGVLVAVGSDWHDLSTNKFHNGEEMAVTVRLLGDASAPLLAGSRVPVAIEFPPGALAGRVEPLPDSALVLNARLIPTSGTAANIEIALEDRTPALWREMARSGKKEFLAGSIAWERSDAAGFPARLLLDPVKFTRLNAVTNDGFIRYAKTAVELAIGLIGIMALWLGVMKIAEQSGLVTRIAAMVRPLTTRLFPDVPPDHPAMGAMIMNISANMLGLSNAATPLGLKAMEELNKLNRKVGTATDAMCTFLVINTSSVQLIPATVIALRAAAGSSNPTEILGPVIVATTVNTLVGIVTVKLLARLPYFRRQLSAEAP